MRGAQRYPDAGSAANDSRNFAGQTTGQRGEGSDGVPAGPSFIYDSIYQLLRQKILDKELPSGALLKEASVASHLGVSRAPVRRALLMLAETGLVTAAVGQGYLVGNGMVRRMSPRDLHDILAPATDEIDRTATWERIFARVSTEILSLMPFGTYRIQEAELGDYHHVSRTVAREVLWRLIDARLIEKDRKSHWIVGQMTARDVRDSLEMRQVLEPKALAHVAGGLDPSWLDGLIAKIDGAIATFPHCGGPEIDAIEDAMFHTMYENLRNARMLGSIRRNQFALIVPRLFRQHFSIRDDLAALTSYAQLLRLLGSGSVEAAQVLLGSQLARSEPLLLARLRVLAILPPPVTVPYMIAED
jgi:DNA-binding GntR family transcriptional regulator